MRSLMALVLAAAAVVGGAGSVLAEEEAKPASGLDIKGIPISVWAQQPRHAERYKAIGINLYLALYGGPTQEQLAELKKAGMPAVCDQNEEGLKDEWKDTIVGWMHGDEPDNAQAIPGKEGWGPPIKPEVIVAHYKDMKKKDDRPVVLNLGMGVAWDGWYGRGVRTNKPEDYPEYVKGCDIASFDIYPVSDNHKDVTGKLWYVGQGVARLKEWAKPRPVWAVIETTHISNPGHQPTVEQVRSEVWMAVAHGATGIVYFVHVFKPKENDAALLADAEMSAGVKAINAEVQSLAGPILEGKEAPEVKIESSEKDGTKTWVRQWKGDVYVIVVGMKEGTRKVRVATPKAKNVVALVGGGSVKSEGAAAITAWTEEIKDYGVRVWKVEPTK